MKEATMETKTPKMNPPLGMWVSRLPKPHPSQKPTKPLCTEKGVIGELAEPGGTATD